MVNKETKKITVEEVNDGLFSSCNCCNATTIKDGPASFGAKKVDKMYRIRFGDKQSVLVAICEDCLKQLIGEITVALNGNTKKD